MNQTWNEAAAGQGLNQGMGERMHQSTRDELQDVVDTAEEMLETLGDDGSAAMADMRARIRNTVDTARSRLHDAEARARDAASEAAGTADEYVHVHPWTSVALAAALGVIAGAVLSRRH